MYKYDDIIGKVEPQNDAVGLAVNLNDLKGFLKIDEVSSEEDAILTSLIKVATDLVEARTHRVLLTQTFKLYTDHFPARDLRFPHGPVSSISSISYVDASEQTQTLSTAIYELDNKALVPVLALKNNFTYPNVSDNKNSVTITYTAGYGSRSDIPEMIRHCIKMVAAHWYDNRDMTIPAGMEQILSTLLKPYVLPKL